MVSDLLPLESEAPKCREFTRNLGVSPGGSGLRLDRVVLVSVPEPWPKPALGHPLIKPLVSAITSSPVATRLFAATPATDAVSVEVFDRVGLGARSARWSVDAADVGDVVDSVASRPVGRVEGMTDVVEPTFLVCTQGSHDDCCGVFGEDLAVMLDDQRPYRVRRVSHTGGHRFAPTLLALPSGRMWAFADIELVDRIATGLETPEDLTARCRGWWGAAGGAAQVAELAARAMSSEPFGAEPAIDNDGRAWSIAVDGKRWVVEVDVLREVPSIACGAPGGLPAKRSREFAARVSVDG